MENCTDEMLEVTVYKSSVSAYFNKYNMDYDDPFFDTPDNMMELMFPRSIVEAWYSERICTDDDGENFDDWFYNESTADGTDGLYDFAVEHGFKPDFPKPQKYMVNFSATYEVYAFDKDMAYDVAQKQFNDYDDYYVYIDGKLYS